MTDRDKQNSINAEKGGVSQNEGTLKAGKRAMLGLEQQNMWQMKNLVRNLDRARNVMVSFCASTGFTVKAACCLIGTERI